jgi:exopolysaccharide biosynthesis polyprenyl glycosylphosphotransferase
MTRAHRARVLVGRAIPRLRYVRRAGSERTLRGEPFASRAGERRRSPPAPGTVRENDPARSDAEREPEHLGRGTDADALLLGGWDLVATLVVFAATSDLGSGLRGWIAKVLASLLALMVINGVGGYRRTIWLREHPVDVIQRLLVASTILAWSVVLVTLALGLRTRLAPLIITWVALPIAWYAGRRAATLARRARPERILIVGTGAVAHRVTELSRRPGNASVVVGCLDDGFATESTDGAPILGGIDQLPHLLGEGGIDRVIVAFSSRADYDTLDVLRRCGSYRGTVDIVPRFFEFVGPKSMMYRADGLAFLSIPARQIARAEATIKRAIDIVASCILLVALSPLLLIIAVAILLDSGPPVLFRQRRIGRHGAPFSIVKFRTLTRPTETPWEGAALELTPESIALHVEQAKRDAARRATRVGALLRETSLDELPQLFNVLVGHMSLVGPRPLSPLEDAALEGWELLRRDMRPGITGLWQVSGRSEVSWKNRINLDYYQVRHWSLSSDLHVLADTVRAVLRRRGAE